MASSFILIDDIGFWLKDGPIGSRWEVGKTKFK